MQLIGAGLLAIINAPVIGQLAKGIAYIAGFFSPLIAAFGVFAAGVTLFQATSVKLAAQLVWHGVKWLAGAAMTLLASAPFQALVWPITLLASAFGAGYVYFTSMAEDLKDLNDKTPDPRDKTNAGLTGQIFSQLLNIVTSTNTNYMQREMLQTQKELVRLAREQNDRTNPNNSLVTPTHKRAIAGGI